MDGGLKRAVDRAVVEFEVDVLDVLVFAMGKGRKEKERKKERKGKERGGTGGEEKGTTVPL
jgi:hypothetical protein